MKPENSIRRLLVPAAILVASSVSFIGTLGCETIRFFGGQAKYDEYKAEEKKQEEQAAKAANEAAAQAASKGAVDDAVQQSISTQIPTGQMGGGDF